MYRTKKDVDKHVQDINQKIKSPTERALKGYFIAKLYFQVGDNESARKYIEGYLAEKDSHVIAHKLAGQIYQALKQTEKALSSYKTCYQLDTTQKDVLETIGQLLLELPIDPGRTKYWVEQVEKSIPNSNILYRLREALVSKTDGETSKEFETMLINEINGRQTDVNLRIRLIRYYQRVGRIKDGYEYVLKCENTRSWPNSLNWYTTTIEVLENYQVAYKSNVGKDFYGLFLSALDSAISLEIIEDAQYSRLAELLGKMDVILQEASSSPVPPEKPVAAHFQAQLYYHIARLVYKKLAKDISPGSMKEHHRTLGAALLAAYAIETAELGDNTAKWSHLPAAAAIRRSISGHCLISLAEKFGGLDTYKERLAASITAKGINSKLASLVFVSATERSRSDESGFLAASGYPIDMGTVKMPEFSLAAGGGCGDLVLLDKAAVEGAASDLNSLVWILLRYYQTGKVLDLNFPLPELSGLPELPSPPYQSVSNLDANCFIYAVVYGAGYLEKDRNEDYVLPPYIGSRLTISNQEEWWKLAAQAGTGTLNPQDKRTLQFGLDAIRCKGLHGLDAQLLLKLGKTYECHALEASATADADEHAHKMVAVLEARAALYFKAALSAIEKLNIGVSPRVPMYQLFTAGGPDPSGAELAKMRETATFYLGTENMHQGLMEEALSKFKEVRTAYASFYSAEIYRKLADEEKAANAGSVQVSGAYLNYLTEARECLYLTLDRLKNEPSGHALNANIGDMVEELENLIHESEGAEVGSNNGNGGVTVNNRFGDYLSSTPRHTLAANMLLRRHELSTMAVGGGSGLNTPANRSLFEEREAKPSPERLDAQIRQLNHTQENLVRQISGRETELVDYTREILDIIKSSSTDVKDLTSSISELKSSQVQASAEMTTQLKHLAEIKEDVKQLSNIRRDTRELSDIKQDISTLRSELRVYQCESLDKFGSMVKLLKEILDKPVMVSPGAPSGRSVETSLTEEEKLLIESFGVGLPGQGSHSPAVSAYNNLLVQQQLMMMHAAAAQPRPQLLPPGGPGILPGMYAPQPAGLPSSFAAPGVQLPTVPNPQIPTTPQPLAAAVQPGHQSVIINQSAAPSTTTPKLNKPVETGPPTNVVISKSDKIPTGAAIAPMVSMSVTVPPQHRLGVMPNQQQQSPAAAGVIVTPKLGGTPSSGFPPSGGGAFPPSTPLSSYKTPVAVTPSTPIIPATTPNSFQIKLPEGSALVTSSPFERAGLATAPVTTTTSTTFLASIPSPQFSAVTPSPEKSAQRTPGTTPKTRLPSTTEEPEEYEPQVDFKPVIPLPEEVQVVTGEEDEEVLWEDRAKLFRFSADDKEWKERGLGQARILKNKETGKIRFLMRREQTLKVCANHLITATITIDKMKGNAKARIWATHQDFADGEAKAESFCIRMKTEEQVDKFEIVFKDAVMNAVSSPKKDTTDSKPPAAATAAAAPKSMADIVAAQKASTWECQGCFSRNDNAKIKCPACETAKPGCEEEVKKMAEAAKPVITIGAGGGFKFGSGGTTTLAAPATTGGFKFGSGSTPSTGGLTFGTPKTTQESGGLTFGTPKTTQSTTGTTFGTPKTTQGTTGATFGGFTFSTTPTIKKEETKDKPEEKSTDSSAAKPNIFSGFSFGTKVETVGETAKPKDEDKPVLGGGATLSFSSLATTNGGEEVNVFKTSGNNDSASKPFATTGNVLFASQKKKEDGDEEGGDEDYEPDVDFKPVVPLPDLIEVKTGEEDEEALFSERCKLFRFASETKEWKERGIGEFKVYKNKKTGRVRFLMRREQVLKLCCNHLLTADLEIRPMSTSDKAFTWTAQDYSEGELKAEMFCLRFKNSEMAKNWKDIVEKAKEGLKELGDISVNEESPEKEKSEPKKETTTSAPKSMAEIAAAQKASSWECQGCLSRNDNSKIKCPACETAKPGCEEEVAKMKEAAQPVMTIGAGGGFKFGGGAAATSSSTGSGFSFGGGATSTPAAATGGGFTFGTPNRNTEAAAPGGFSFGTPSSTKPADSTTATVKSPFGTSEKHEFNFGGIKVSPRKHNDSARSETELYENEDEGEHIYFEPVVPLPDKVEVKTGEEDLTTLYSQRSKLFRYVDNEWKERGLGDIKILRESTGKIRLLMRREQVLKICLNHYITPQIMSNFKEKDAKSWRWAAPDFSEGELEDMMFAIRFKTPEIASEFKKALDNAVDGAVIIPSPGKETKAGSQVPTSSKSKEAEKPAKKDSPTTTSDDELFKLTDFRPLSPIDKEHELSFDGQGMKLNNEDDAKDVADRIRNEKNMHVLTLSGNTVGIEAANAIGKALENHPEFRRAHWKDMFTGRMKTEIPPALVNLTRGIMVAQARLVELDLSDNAFGPVGMDGLVTFLKSPSCFTLQELRFNNTGCGVTGGKMLAKLLKECYNRSVQANHPLALKVFVLGRSRQENEGAAALAEVFGMMGSLEEVVMPQNGIYFEGLTALADAFSKNPNLKILNLNDNTFTAKGAKAMAKALKKLNNLEILNLGDCLLKSGGAKLIARALKGRHPNLKELILDSNEIRIAGGLEVLEGIKDKNNLIKLSMDANCFGEEGEEKLRSKMAAMGKESILADMEDNEEPDLDEEDPDVSCDEDEAPADASAAAPKTTGSLFSGSSNAGTAAKNLFGGGNDTAVTPTIFGTPKAESKSLFGGESATSSPFSFGGKPATSTSNIFGGKTESPSIFGGAKTDSPSIFGGANNNAGSVFDGSTPKTGGSLFGGNGNTSTSIFGGTGSSPASSGSIFGGTAKTTTTSSPFGGSGTIFGGAKSTADVTSSTSIFGAKSETGSSIFGAKSESGSSLFGKSTTSSPGTLFGKPVSSGSADSSSGPAFLSNQDSAATFGALASSGASIFGGQSGDQKTSGSPFSTAGNVLFSRSANKTGGDDDDEVDENEHDPHFEPIVPLPELVQVKTGEEDEQVLFKHRAKVYRHDDKTKEWKERGVGDIKVLHNPARNTYRLLLRREQVHKVALNHLITSSLEMSPMKNSENALCWYATDYSEGNDKGEVSLLACRFKTKATADEFKAKVLECQAALSSGNKVTVADNAVGEESEKGSSIPVIATGANAIPLGGGGGGGATAEDQEDEGEDGDEEYDETREEDEMFTGEGDLKFKEDGGQWSDSCRVFIRIVYDEDLYGARIVARDVDAEEEDLDLCDHLIAIQTNLDDKLSWTGLDYSDGTPVKKSFKIKFDTADMEKDFKDVFAQGKDFADQCGITETRDEEIDPEQLVYGVGGDE